MCFAWKEFKSTLKIAVRSWYLITHSLLASHRWPLAFPIRRSSFRVLDQHRTTYRSRCTAHYCNKIVKFNLNKKSYRLVENFLFCSSSSIGMYDRVRVLSNKEQK